MKISIEVKSDTDIPQGLSKNNFEKYILEYVLSFVSPEERLDTKKTLTVSIDIERPIAHYEDAKGAIVSMGCPTIRSAIIEAKKVHQEFGYRTWVIMGDEETIIWDSEKNTKHYLSCPWMAQRLKNLSGSVREKCDCFDPLEED